MTGQTDKREASDQKMESYIPDALQSKPPPGGKELLRRLRKVDELFDAVPRPSGFQIWVESAASCLIGGIELSAAQVTSEWNRGTHYRNNEFVNCVKSYGGKDPAKEALTQEGILNSHADLISNKAGIVGRIRDVDAWVGGDTPESALYVPPPPDALPDLMDDLCNWIAGAHDGASAIAAVAHAQLAAIHPFVEGNGRVSRKIIWDCYRRERLPLLPISVAFYEDLEGYYKGLDSWREGNQTLWMEWYTERVERAAALLGRMLAERDDLMTMLSAWDGAAGRPVYRHMLSGMVDNPVFTVAGLAKDLKRGYGSISVWSNYLSRTAALECEWVGHSRVFYAPWMINFVLASAIGQVPQAVDVLDDFMNMATDRSPRNRDEYWEGIEHGTAKGYWQHRRRGIKPCDACLKAWSSYVQEHKKLSGDANEVIGEERMSGEPDTDDV